ncbi:MAG: AraC family transcriptional regulator [Alphaproteobacteria bacterium]|nr:AraC family transcriptional regulator [Alphaproteobacteria bacterium]
MRQAVPSLADKHLSDYDPSYIGRPRPAIVTFADVAVPQRATIRVRGAGLPRNSEHADMPSSMVRAFSDPFEYQQFFRAADVELVVTERGEYAADLKRMDFHELWMQRTWQSLPFVARAHNYKTRVPVVFLADECQAPIKAAGQELSPGELVFPASGDEYHYRTWTEINLAMMSLAPDEFSSAARILLGREATAPAVTRFLRPPPELMSKLMILHKAAADLASTAPEIFAHPAVSRAMEQALVGTMIACLAEEADLVYSARKRAHTAVIRKFEEVIEASPDTPLYVIDLCRAMGVTDRTLRLHCHEHLGMSPHRYLWLRRMHLARRSLIRGAAATTVTEIATSCGFGELGRFAVSYRKLFGETPSATLRRHA